MSDFSDLIDPDLGDPLAMHFYIKSILTDWNLAHSAALEESPPLILPETYTGLFQTIEIDFPWQYGDCGFKGWQDVKAYRIHPSYPKMPLKNVDLSFPELSRVADPSGAHGWFWVTKDFLPHIFPLLSKHGWKYKQIFTWIKTNKQNKPAYGMGYWARNAAEFIIFAVLPGIKNPNPPMLSARTSTSNIFEAQSPEGIIEETLEETILNKNSSFYAPKSHHSAKPDLAYELISSLSPAPRLSIFQRAKRQGFRCWGWEMDGAGNGSYKETREDLS